VERSGRGRRNSGRSRGLVGGGGEGLAESSEREGSSGREGTRARRVGIAGGSSQEGADKPNRGVRGAWGRPCAGRTLSGTGRVATGWPGPHGVGRAGTGMVSARSRPHSVGVHEACGGAIQFHLSVRQIARPHPPWLRQLVPTHPTRQRGRPLWRTRSRCRPWLSPWRSSPRQDQGPSLWCSCSPRTPRSRSSATTCARKAGAPGRMSRMIAQQIARLLAKGLAYAPAPAAWMSRLSWARSCQISAHCHCLEHARIRVSRAVAHAHAVPASAPVGQLHRHWEASGGPAAGTRSPHGHTWVPVPHAPIPRPTSAWSGAPSHRRQRQRQRSSTGWSSASPAGTAAAPRLRWRGSPYERETGTCKGGE
jgi:hypothetical protein